MAPADIGFGVFQLLLLAHALAQFEFIQPRLQHFPCFGPVAVLAVLLGVNIGPNATYPGSLANLLWRNIIRREGMSASFLEFSRVGALTTPLCLVAGVLALWAAARVLGL